MGRAQISGRLWYAFPLGIPQDYLNIFEIHSNPAKKAWKPQQGTRVYHDRLSRPALSLSARAWGTSVKPHWMQKKENAWRRGSQVVLAGILGGALGGFSDCGWTEVKSAEEVFNSSSFLQRPAVHKLQMLARRMHCGTWNMGQAVSHSCLRRFVQQLISSFVSLKLL